MGTYQALLHGLPSIGIEGVHLLYLYQQIPKHFIVSRMVSLSKIFVRAPSILSSKAAFRVIDSHALLAAVNAASITELLVARGGAKAWARIVHSVSKTQHTIK